jgi:hypothetical protein
VSGWLARVSVVVCVVMAGFVVPVGSVGAVVQPRVLLGDVGVYEGDAAAMNVSVPLTLSVPAVVTTTVFWSVTAGGAASGSDFVAKTGKTSFLVGQTQKSVAVRVYGDTAVEGDETVNVTVTNVVGASVGDGTGVVTLLDDDANGVSSTIEAALGRPTVWEGDSGTQKVVVPVTLSQRPSENVSVRFKTDCPARKGEWPAVSVKLVFLAGGGRIQNVGLKYAPNATPNANLGFPVTLSLVGGNASIATPRGTAVILDDEGGATAPTNTVRASERADGGDPSFATLHCNGGMAGSGRPAISGDGRYVAFSSDADNLVPSDTNNHADVFVKDTTTGAIERVNVASDGSQADGESQSVTISGDGRYVIFLSFADNLVPNDDNSWYDEFLYDRTTGSLARIGDIHDYHSGSSGSSISADGRYVTFQTNAFLADDTDPCIVITSTNGTATTQCKWGDVFLWDRDTDTVTVVTTSSTGQPSAGGVATISADGRHVAYITSDNSQVVPGDNNGTADVFVKDLDTGDIEMVSVNSAGDISQGWGVYPTPPSISADGQLVGFMAEVCNFGVACLPYGRNPVQIYLRDRTNGTTTLATGTPMSFSLSVRGFSASDNGRYVAFTTNESDINPGSTCPGTHIYEHDRTTGTTTAVDRFYIGAGCPNDSSEFEGSPPKISSDGKYVTYQSWASNLIPDDYDNALGVFVTHLT